MKSRVSVTSTFQQIGRSSEKSTLPKVRFSQCTARESSVKDGKKKSRLEESQKWEKRKKKKKMTPQNSTFFTTFEW
jgi:hypothetical protein